MGGRLSTPSLADRDREREQANGGRSYSGFLISDHARVHNGDHYTIQNYYLRSVPSPDFVLQEACLSSYAESALASRKRKRLEAASFDGVPRQNANHHLHLAAGQLGEFSLSLQHQKQDQDAQRVARWVRILLDAVETNGSSIKLEHKEGELASLRDGLVFVNRVSVNSPLVKQRLATLPLVKKNRRTSIVSVGGLQIHLDTLTCTSLDALGEKILQTTSMLQVAPTAPLSIGTPDFAVIFGEKTDSVQRSIIHPRILAYRTVDSESAAFVLLFQGDDVDGLTRLLATQQATLRDCDVNGRSLLTAASCFRRFECLKFLIASGADVNRMEHSYGEDEESPWVLPPLSDYTFGQASRFPRALQCLELLIDAGADSTMVPYSTRSHGPNGIVHKRSILFLYMFAALTSEQPVDHDARVDTAEKIYVLLDGAYDAPENMGSSLGMTIWMITFQLATTRRIVLRPKLLRKLLNAGCDVAEVCAFSPDAEGCWMNGVNGLFLYVIFAKDPWWSNDLEVVLFLLAASAEPFGSIVNGQMVCNVAYKVAASESPLGSYWRDLLFCALARAGTDVGRFFEYPLQMPYYTKYYTIWHHRCLCYLDSWDGFYLNEDLLRWLERQPWPGDDTEAMYRFASGGGRDSIFEEAVARWQVLYTEFKARQREGRFEELSPD